MNIDVERARAETPGCEKVLHFNNAGSSLPPARVVDTQVDWLRQEAVTGGYELKAERDADIERTYSEVAGLLGASSDEVALVENATFAWHQAFWSLPLRPGDRILTGTVEYASSYISYLQAERDRGITIEVIPDDEYGQLDVKALAKMLDGPQPPALVAIAHVPTNGGVVNPAEEVGRLTRAAGVPFLLDACQSVGQMPVDVDAIGCDMLSATGRKFLRAPRGTGFLYVRSGLLERLQLEPPFLDLLGATWTGPGSFELRGDARRFENWEASWAGVVGLGEAVAYARSWGLAPIEQRVTSLAADLRRRLSGIPGVQVHDLGQRRCGIVTFTKAGTEAAEAQARLAAQKMNVSVSSPPSTLLDFDRRQLPALTRASLHYYNNEDEIDRFCGAVDDL